MIRRAKAARATTVVQLPNRGISVWENIPDVRTTIAQFDQGLWKMAALLADEIFRDDRINGVLSTRADALTAAPIVTEPSDDSRKAAKVRDVLGDDNDPDGLFDEMFPDEVISDVSLGGNVLNVGLAKVEWEVRDGMSIPRITPWHAQWVRYDWSSKSYKVLTENMGEIELPRFDLNPRGDGNWLLWTPYGYQTSGLRRAMIRWLGEAFIMRRWNQADWANYNEVHGKPTKIAYVPSGHKGQDDFFDDVDGAGSGSTIKVPRSLDVSGKDTGYGYGLVEALARTWDTFKTFKEALDSGIAIGVLGGNLATETKEGSFAASREQTPVRIDRLRKDARLQKCLRIQVLSHWAERNFGDPKLAPRVRFEVEPPEDETEEGAAYQALGTGVKALKDAGFPVDVRSIGEAKGLPMLSEEDEAAQKQKALEDQATAMANVGGAGGAPPAPAAKAPATDKDGAPKAPAAPKPAGKTIAASARYVAVPPQKRYEFQGLPIAVENPKGTTRFWRDEDGGETGHTTMQHDYGYIEGVTGADKEELDCYVGPDAEARDVHIVHQLRAPDFKGDDEDKVMLGFSDAGAAKAAFLAHRNDGDRSFGGMSTVPVERFKAKLNRRTGTGKIRAEGVTYIGPDDMLDEARRRILAAAPGRARKRAKLYGDRVADNAIALAEKAVGPYLRAVRKVIAEADTIEEIRPRLLAEFRSWDPKVLTELAFRARTLARAGGKASALRRL